MNTEAVVDKEPLGANPSEEGTSFSVWAPHADAVSVVGEFNEWNPESNPMERGEDGVWNCFLESAKEGHRYKYHIRRGETSFDRVDPRAMKVVNSAGDGIIWKPKFNNENAFEAPNLNELIVYELHIGTFALEEGKEVGTFAAAIQKLDYLVDLGINAIEVMPVAEFAGDISWGYNPAHPFAVESAYGDPESFRAFVDAAHERGIAVILDVVYNHFGPSDLSIWQFDGWEENGKGGIYFFNDWRSSTPWGETRPDYGRREVRDYIRDNALMWMRTYKVDGLRLDMTVFMRSIDGNPDDPSSDLKDGWSLMQEINEAALAENPRALLIAEDLRDSDWLVKGAGAGGAGFRAQWCAAFVHPVRSVLTQVNDNDRSLDAIVSSLSGRFDGDAFKRVVYSESHDEVANGKARMPSEIDAGTPDSYPARKRSVLGAVLVLTAPGIPMLFQGQEFLEDEWFRDDVPLHWDKSETNGNVLKSYRDLVRLRRNLTGTTAGLSGQEIDTFHVDHERKLIAYSRWRDGGPGDTTVVIINFSAEPVKDYEIGLPQKGDWHVRFNSDATVYGEDFENLGHAECVSDSPDDPGSTDRARIALAPYSAIILSQDPS